MEQVTVTFKKNKTFVIETSGFVGTACQDVTRGLEAALGTVVSDTPTAEAYLDPLQAEREVGR